MFEVTASGVFDGDANGRAVVVNVVGRGLEIDTALSLTRFNGHSLAVGQGHSNRRLSRIAQGDGIGDHAAFGHARRSRERCGSGVDGISHLGDRRRLRQCDGQAATASTPCNGRRDLPAINVRRIVCRYLDIDTAACLPRRNGDHGTIGQGNHQVGSWRLTHGGGIDDDATRFTDGRGGAEDKVSSNGGVGGRWGHQIVVGAQLTDLHAVERGYRA